MELIYLDNNATTRPAPPVVEAMLPYFTQLYGNPSSVHRFGQRARQALDEARARVAALIGAPESTVSFTGGGTEAINTVIRGLLAARAPRRRIVTSSVEHSATRELCAQLRRDGAEVVTVGVDRRGELDMDALASAIDEQTALVTLLWANNETGVLFPIERIAERCQASKVPLHCDATQAAGKIAIDVKNVAASAMSFAPHKFHGPKGVGVIYQRRGVRFGPMVIGGPQENGRRGGTENVPGIVGAGVAAELAAESLASGSAIAGLRDRLETGILAAIDSSQVNGAGAPRVVNTTNIGFPRLEAEAILLLLSEQGVAASAGSACSSGSLEPSPVLQAMGIDEKLAHGSIRFSLSRYTTAEEIEQALRIMPGVIRKLQAVLPTG